MWEAPKFRVGDRVKVVRALGLELAVGSVTAITTKNSKINYRVQIDGQPTKKGFIMAEDELALAPKG